MSLNSMLAILEERGLSICVDEDGKAKIRGPKGEITEGVREVLSAYRTEIIERFKPKPRRQFLWRFGHIYTDPDNMPETWFPIGSWWWRYEGEKEWRPIPGRPVQGQPLEVVT